MTPQLFSIEHVPPSLPVWHAILEDLAHPPVHRVARVLGVSRRTVYRWNAAGSAPRVACLALFWLTRWGRSAVHTQAANDAVMAVSLVRGLERRVGELTAQVGHLERLGGYGSANEPLRDGLGYGGGLSPHGQLQPPDPPKPARLIDPAAGSGYADLALAAARPGSLLPDPLALVNPVHPAGVPPRGLPGPKGPDDHVGAAPHGEAGRGPEGPPA